MADSPEKNKKIVKKSETELDISAVPPEKLCVICGQKKKANGSDYCRDCKKELQKIKLPAAGWIFAALIVIVCAASCALSFMNFAPEKKIADAKKAAAELRLNDAYKNYGYAFNLCTQLNSELKGIISTDLIFAGNQLHKDEMKAYASIYGKDYAGSILGSYFTEAEIKADSELSEYSAAYDVFMKAQGLVTDIFTDCSSGKISVEEAKEKVKALEKDNPDVLKWLIFFQCDLEAELGEADPEVEIEYMERLRDTAPELTEIYDPVLIECYYSLKKYDECKEVCRKRAALNRNDIIPNVTLLKTAFIEGDKKEAQKTVADFKKYNDNNEGFYILSIMLNRYLGDNNAALDDFQQANNLGFDGAEINRQQALNFLQKGDLANAFNRAYNAYSIASGEYTALASGGSSFSAADIIETLYLVAMLYDRDTSTETKDQYLPDVVAMFSSEDVTYTPGEKVSSILSGELSLADALTKGSGDII